MFDGVLNTLLVIASIQYRLKERITFEINQKQTDPPAHTFKFLT